MPPCTTTLSIPMNREKPFRYYSVRRLNPFHGVIQVAGNEEARALALSPDGLNWEVQIRARQPDMWGAEPKGEPTYQFLRFRATGRNRRRAYRSAVVRTGRRGRRRGPAGKRNGTVVIPSTSQRVVSGTNVEGTWDTPLNQTLVSNYLNWLSPRLLTLQQISDATRHRLEIAARCNAREVARNWTLYPNRLNHAAIEALRVEARLRQASTPAK
ncbi:MAG: hypothetical protein GY703_20460 [Gammaproteobacteria bacterium]|nr:hypothetical protein [Gammaproteobacteria bacterium]